MRSVTITALRVVIALSLAGSIVVQAVILPLLWSDLADAGVAVALRVTVVAMAAVGVLSLQVFAVCVWRLLGLVRRGAVFTPRAFRDVDVIIVAISVAAALVFGFAVLLAPGDAAPGIVGLVCGLALVLAGIALLVVVLRMLLRQAIEREDEARALRTELGGVI